MMGLAHFVLASRAERLRQLEDALRRLPGGEWRRLYPDRVTALWLVRADHPEEFKAAMVVCLDSRESFEAALKELEVGNRELEPQR